MQVLQRTLQHTFAVTSGEAGGRLKAASEAEPQPHRGRPEDLHQHRQVSAGGHRQGEGHQVTGCRPQYAGRTYSLLTTFPNKEITDDAATVSGAGLVGAAVLQRIK